jgi:drug/metabolite transporter (DMT)-like permease
MFYLTVGILSRIISNSFINVFQKKLTATGEMAAVVNFNTYLGLTIMSFWCCQNIHFNPTLFFNIGAMGLFGCLGNYFIIKALSLGDLSTIAPINAYKPIVALIFGMFFLNEIPSIISFLGMSLIIGGTLLLTNHKIILSKAFFYRFVALVLSGTEAIFIKKVIILTDINSAFFFWAFSGLIFSFFLALKHSLKISRQNLLAQILLILMVGLMQYSTNFVFSKMNVAYALALFQLSSILSVILGANLFKETNFIRKLCASLVMVIGASVLILC